MTYLKKEHRNLLHEVNDIIEVRSDTLSENEFETYDKFKTFLNDVDAENDKLKTYAVEKTRGYRADPKAKKKVKKQNHQQYLRRKEKLMQERLQKAQEEQ